MSFQQKLLQSRMENAKYLLRATDKPVSEIAGIIGYADTTAFSRGFRQNTGLTPVQYRTQEKKRKNR